MSKTFETVWKRQLIKLKKKKKIAKERISLPDFYLKREVGLPELGTIGTP